MEGERENEARTEEESRCLRSLPQPYMVSSRGESVVVLS